MVTFPAPCWLVQYTELNPSNARLMLTKGVGGNSSPFRVGLPTRSPYGVHPGKRIHCQCDVWGASINLWTSFVNFQILSGIICRLSAINSLLIILNSLLNLWLDMVQEKKGWKLVISCSELELLETSRASAKPNNIQSQAATDCMRRPPAPPSNSRSTTGCISSSCALVQHTHVSTTRGECAACIQHVNIVIHERQWIKKERQKKTDRWTQPDRNRQVITNKQTDRHRQTGGWTKKQRIREYCYYYPYQRQKIEREREIPHQCGFSFSILWLQVDLFGSQQHPHHLHKSASYSIVSLLSLIVCECVSLSKSN